MAAQLQIRAADICGKRPTSMQLFVQQSPEYQFNIASDHIHNQQEISTMLIQITC